YGKGLFKDASILVSIIFGYILSLILGIVNFSSIQEFTLVALPIAIKKTFINFEKQIILHYW
ncbi:solute carrier family 23 protein, partial [Clostridioides difficile]